MTEWLGKTTCDNCEKTCIIHLVDGRTYTGKWGVFCIVCSYKLGIRLGSGRGQMYERKDNKFVKVVG